MNRNLASQMRHEWRDNIWMVVELVIVLVVVCVLSGGLYSILENINEPKGFDVTDVYVLDVMTVPDNSPTFQDHGDRNYEFKCKEMRFLLDKVRKSPYVEVAGFANNALPYCYNYSGNMLFLLNELDSIGYYGNLRMGSPELARVIGLQGKGLSTSQMEDLLRRGELLIYIDDKFIQSADHAKKMLGQQVILGRDSLSTYRVGGEIESVRRSDYEMPIGTIFKGVNEDVDEQLQYIDKIAVRVKPGMGGKFKEQFLSSREMKRSGNVYLSNIQSMKDVRHAVQYTSDSMVRLYLAGVVFLLIIVFFGLLGTFWFRIQQRVHEIALRKTCGASSFAIFRRIITEGLVLLGIAAIPAAAIVVMIVKYLLRDVEGPSSAMSDFYTMAAWCFVASVVLMVMIIIAGISFPARKAMKVEPAIALKEE